MIATKCHFYLHYIVLYAVFKLTRTVQVKQYKNFIFKAKWDRQLTFNCTFFWLVILVSSTTVQVQQYNDVNSQLATPIMVNFHSSVVPLQHPTKVSHGRFLGKFFKQVFWQVPDIFFQMGDLWQVLSTNSPQLVANGQNVKIGFWWSFVKGEFFFQTGELGRVICQTGKLW